MAKIAFTKLGLTKNQEVKYFSWNDQIIDVKQYLPVQEKLDLISDVLNNCQDENNFINLAKLQVYFDLEVIFKYTNINFTEKQKEDVCKLYDLLKGSGLLDQIINDFIPEKEYKELQKWLYDIAHNIYEYRNSIYGVLTSVAQDYSSLDLDATELQKKIGDPENLALLRNILDKIG